MKTTTIASSHDEAGAAAVEQRLRFLGYLE